MIAVAFYLLKVIVCSGILYGYYHLMLRDKVFHQWNRFYLLGSVLISMLLPLIQVELNTPVQPESKVITVLQIVSGADEYVREVNAKPLPWVTAELISIAAYLLVSLATLTLFLAALRKIHRMIRRNESIPIEDFYFLNTAEPGTPFSYFRYLLWNREITLDSDNGQRILEHELVHIREKHSWDKLFIQLVLVLFWINPFFWLIRRELTLVHEFIADRKTVGQGDAQAFARLLLETSFPGYAPMMTNSFFSSSIKRRLAMMTKKQHPGLNYFSRLMMIPVLFILLFAFGVKAKTLLHDNPQHLRLDKPVTVVIDAGHGGTDAGAMSGESTEKELSLTFAKLIRQLNTNSNIKILLSRESDVLQPIRDKVAFTEKEKADLFVSIHVNSSPDELKKGIEVFVPSTNMTFENQNARIATLILQNMKGVYHSDLEIKKRKQKIFVLDHNICPSVMLELGYLSNENDLQFISNTVNQEKLARQVLKSIEDYFNPSIQLLAATNSPQAPDTSIKPKIELRKYEDQITIKSGQVSKGDMIISSDTVYIKGPISLSTKKSLPMDVSYTVDGKPSYPAAVDRIRPEDIHSISINKGNSVSDKGSIDILTKNGVKHNPSLVRNFEGRPGLSTFNATDGMVLNNVETSMYSAPTKEVLFTGEASMYLTPNKDVYFTGEASTKLINAKPVLISVSGKASTTSEVSNVIKVKRDPDTPLPLFVVNGEEKSQEEVNQLIPDNIASIRILKGDDAEKSYGAKGKNGVILITTRK